MRKKVSVYVFFVLLVFFSGFVYGSIPATERSALIVFYNSTAGDNWVDSSGWKTPPLHSDGFAMPGTEKDWYGISVSNDHVWSIGLENNNLRGSIPSALGNLKQLRYIQIGDQTIIGSIPPELGNLSELISLAFLGTNLTGIIPPELGNLSNLQSLGLQNNDLTGSIPAELGNLTNLVYINLFGNPLTGNIPKELGNLSKLEDLSFGLNQLTGTIPKELGNLISLKTLVLKMNQLSGIIPPELGNLSNLTELELNDNQLTGSIPSEIGNLSNLKELELYNNQLSGNIPKELGSLSNLSFLKLSSNQLSGSIPPELGDLSGLFYLYLNNNKLSGAIPTSLAKLTNLSSPDVDIGYNCLYTEDTDLKLWLDNVDPDWENNQSECTPEICVNRSHLNFGIDTSGPATSSQTFFISNSKEGYLNWVITDNVTWLNYSSESGIGPEVITVTFDVTGLSVGSYSAIIAVSDINASNSPQLINVTLNIYNPNQTSAPFGSFSTPVEGSTVSSSIPVTGWALDDIELESVKIYREKGANPVYIGDAVFVEGARPDIEAAYPDYPMNYKAGWGYMMLTNFLPNGGNGVFKIHAVATDKEGQTTTLGVKTITVDNANAVKPFGAIDTPTQGGTASGSSFINWGWVLTPQPNSIPTDGLTINVFVDSVNLGHLTYNIYRADIATLFPGYANSNGAIGHFSLDTTAYENGVHTIFWTAEDNAGNVDGIGSRYFVIQNFAGSMGHGAWSKAHGAWSMGHGVLKEIPVDYSGSVGIRKGYGKDVEPQAIYPKDNGIINIEIKELERIELHLDDNNYSTQVEVEFKVEEKGLKNSKFIIQNSKFYSGYQVIGSQFRPLPVGSTFDTKRGIFYWQPGVGFNGDYEFVFIKAEGNDRRKIRIKVKILPKYTKQ